MTRGADVVILIVDDDDGHAVLIRRALRRSGIENPSVWLASGESALDFLGGRGPDAARPGDDVLVLLDINLGAGINGVDVLRQLKAAPETRRVPVIMMSTADDPKQIALCRSLGCGGFFTKPLDPTALAEIRGHLASSPGGGGGHRP